MPTGTDETNVYLQWLLLLEMFFPLLTHDAIYGLIDFQLFVFCLLEQLFINLKQLL